MGRIRRDELTPEVLAEFVSYDKDTGLFTRVKDHPRARAGSQIGKDCGHGYIRFHVQGLSVYAHRAAWMLSYGSIPTGWEIDHINRDKHDNRISNLRLVTRGINMQNTGARGVCYSPARGKWRAYISVHRSQYHLGYFDNLVEAMEAREAGKEKHFSELPQISLAKPLKM